MYTIKKFSKFKKESRPCLSNLKRFVSWWSYSSERVPA
jgi:hypothetical protein